MFDRRGRQLRGLRIGYLAGRPDISKTFGIPGIATTDYLSGGRLPVNVNLAQPSITGSISLHDGNFCGTNSEFFGIYAAATVSLLNASGRRVEGPIRASEKGAYSIPFRPDGAAILLQCENATPIKAPYQQPEPNWRH